MEKNTKRNIPSPTASDGRALGGRFGVGNKFSLGNPHAKRVGQLRTALYAAIASEDLGALMRALVVNAIAGDTAAAKLVLAYSVGSPHSVEEMQLESLKEKEEKQDAFLDLIPREFLNAIVRGDVPPKLVIEGRKNETI